VYGFLKRYGLDKEVRVNIEANHAMLAGHTFEHEISTAGALGFLDLWISIAAMRCWVGTPTSSRMSFGR